MSWKDAELIIDLLCFGYPFVMAWYWSIGAIMFHLLRERGEPAFATPPPLQRSPPVSILVPCFNEQDQVEETFTALARVAYPDFEVIAINDGSRDNTGPCLEAAAARFPKMRVVHLARNGGKASAMNAGAVVARHEILVCIDGDTLLDPHALTWFIRRFQNDARIGGITGNPRIRNRTTLLGQLQVGEFSSIVGLIKRAQSIYGALFTASGAVCAYRKRALYDAGWWSADSITDDVDVSWRLQMAGWHMAFEPKALAWILTPETLRGLWRQRLRWSEGGAGVALRAPPQLLQGRGARMWPIWINWAVSIVWAYATLIALLAALVHSFGVGSWVGLHGIGFLPGQFGLILAIHYLLQAAVAAALDSRFEPGIMRKLFWIVWYPLVFWVLQAVAAIVGLPLALLRRRQGGRWISPDRGLRE